jgi:hypothetical protein
VLALFLTRQAAQRNGRGVRTGANLSSNELKVRVKARLIYYGFDFLNLDGFDLRRAPLVQRKRVLAEVLSGVGLNLIRFCEHVEGDGATVPLTRCSDGGRRTRALGANDLAGDGSSRQAGISIGS